MTEMMQKAGDIEITDDYLTKMDDAVRKLDEAYSASKEAITSANDFDSVCDAAKKYAYLKYRVVRLQYYMEIMRAYLNNLSDMNERYGAQVVGFEAAPCCMSSACATEGRGVRAKYQLQTLQAQPRLLPKGEWQLRCVLGDDSTHCTDLSSCCTGSLQCVGGSEKTTPENCCQFAEILGTSWVLKAHRVLCTRCNPFRWQIFER